MTLFNYGLVRYEGDQPTNRFREINVFLGLGSNQLALKAIEKSIHIHLM